MKLSVFSSRELMQSVDVVMESWHNPGLVILCEPFVVEHSFCEPMKYDTLNLLRLLEIYQKPLSLGHLAYIYI